MRTVAAVPTTVPGSPRQMTHCPPVFAAGFPSMSTVTLPATTRPCWAGGAMNGSETWRPTCGGVFIPDEPTTAAGLPPIRTLVARPMSSGAENGIGGAGNGLPTGGPGIWCPMHVPMIRSPITAAGVPGICAPFLPSVELDRAALHASPPAGPHRYLPAHALEL